ncbi:MAG TPA: hypothetical protein VM123_02695 [archaeon]|nr:hypothetical protein [archaeon]
MEHYRGGFELFSRSEFSSALQSLNKPLVLGNRVERYGRKSDDLVNSEKGNSIPHRNEAGLPIRRGSGRERDELRPKLWRLVIAYAPNKDTSRH